MASNQDRDERPSFQARPRDVDDGSPFAAPGSLGRTRPSEASEAEIQQALSYARAVAFLLVVTGVVMAAQVVQLLLFVYQGRLEVVLAEVLFGAQAALFWGAALRVSDGSAWGTMFGAAVGIGGALSSGGWWLWLLAHGALSLLPLCIAPLSAAGALACLVFLRFANTIEDARRLDDLPGEG